MFPIGGQRAGDGQHVVAVRVGVQVQDGRPGDGALDVLNQGLGVGQFTEDQVDLFAAPHPHAQPHVIEKPAEQGLSHGADGVDGGTDKDDHILQLGKFLQPHLKAHNHGRLIDAQQHHPDQFRPTQPRGVEQGEADGSHKQEIIAQQDGAAQPLSAAAHTEDDDDDSHDITQQYHNSVPHLISKSGPRRAVKTHYTLAPSRLSNASP